MQNENTATAWLLMVITFLFRNIHDQVWKLFIEIYVRILRPISTYQQIILKVHLKKKQNLHKPTYKRKSHK